MFLLFDIGGTNMRIGLSKDGKSLDEFRIIDTPKNYEDGIEAFKHVADRLSGGINIDVICGGIAGPLNKDRASLANSPNIEEWVGKPFVKDLKDYFKCKVVLANDAEIGGLGETVFGRGKGYNIVAYITVGTGLGGARIVEGKIDKNSLGFEPGHQIIEIDGKKTNLEDVVSGEAIERKYKIKPEEIRDPSMWKEVSGMLAVGLNNTAVFWSPDIIVLGGMVVKHMPIETIRKDFSATVKIFKELPKIEKGILGEEAGLWGALELARQNNSPSL